MNTDIYIAAIEAFDVEWNPKYQRRDGQTFCNFFTQDVMKHPYINTPVPNGRCVDMYEALLDNKFPNWHGVSFSDAQKLANKGVPTIAITAIPNHVAVVRPNNGNDITQIRDITVAQAGATNSSNITINWCWRKDDLNNIKFYSFRHN